MGHKIVNRCKLICCSGRVPSVLTKSRLFRSPETYKKVCKTPPVVGGFFVRQTRKVFFPPFFSNFERFLYCFRSKYWRISNVAVAIVK